AGCDADSVGLVGADWHADRSATAIAKVAAPTTEGASNLARAAARPPASRAACACGPPRALLVEARNNILRQLRLAVTGGFELGQRLEALLYPLVIHAILGPSRIQLVRLDGLLFERKHLLLEQRVVLLELLAFEILRALRSQEILRERAVQLRDLIRRSGRDLRDVVFGSLLVSLHRCIQRLALGDQTL